MLIQQISILIGGVLTLLLFLFHISFYKLFRWDQEFTKISVVNKKIIYTINLAITLLFLLFGVISLVYVKELARCEGLAFGICLAYALFWLWRLIWQITYFEIPKPTTNKKSAIINYSLIIVFVLLFVAYITPVLMSF
jgi:hypothetical protein